SRMAVEHVERAGIADRHQRQAGALGQREDTDVERMKVDRIDGAQLARAGAGRRLELCQLEAEFGRDPVHRLVELGAGRAGRAAGIVGELHGRPPRPSSRAAAPEAGVRRFRNVLTGAILPRSQSRSTRGRLASARRPCTRSTSAPGSTRPRTATIARKAREWVAMAGTSVAVLALSGSMTRVTIGIAAGHTSSHL